MHEPSPPSRSFWTKPPFLQGSARPCSPLPFLTLKSSSLLLTPGPLHWEGPFPPSPPARLTVACSGQGVGGTAAITPTQLWCLSPGQTLTSVFAHLFSVHPPAKDRLPRPSGLGTRRAVCQAAPFLPSQTQHLARDPETPGAEAAAQKGSVSAPSILGSSEGAWGLHRGVGTISLVPGGVLNEGGCGWGCGLGLD